MIIGRDENPRNPWGKESSYMCLILDIYICMCTHVLTHTHVNTHTEKEKQRDKQRQRETDRETYSERNDEIF